MAILADAAGRCYDLDMRSRRELQDALDYLARVTSRTVYINRFRKALDEPKHWNVGPVPPLPFLA